MDVSQYVKSCDLCQKTTPKGKVFPVPLGSMPLISTPFERVAVDLVGPLSPPSSQGHRYILTIIDVATSYPEAVPLKDISAISVAEALLTVFFVPEWDSKTRFCRIRVLNLILIS